MGNSVRGEEALLTPRLSAQLGSSRRSTLFYSNLRLSDCYATIPFRLCGMDAWISPF